MKTVKDICLLFCLAAMFSANAQDKIFEENFSYITETWYGNTALPADDYDLYFDNSGWTGENVVLGSPTVTGNIPFNDINKPRISVWKGANDHITTPVINSTGGVTISAMLKLCARSNTGITWDFPKVNFLHSTDGENFELISTINLQQEFTKYFFYIENGTANSKYRFQVFQSTDPNRFFIDSVIVKTGNLTSVKSNVSEDFKFTVHPDKIELDQSLALSSVMLLNSSGYLVYKGNEPIINTTSFPSGIYLLQAISIDNKKMLNKILLK